MFKNMEINRGGCAIYAVAQKMKNGSGKIYFGFSAHSMDAAETLESGDEPMACHHAFYVDTDGFCHDGEYGKMTMTKMCLRYGLQKVVEVSLENAVEHINASNDWNNDFDREKNVPVIDAALDLNGKLTECIDLSERDVFCEEDWELDALEAYLDEIAA